MADFDIRTKDPKEKGRSEEEGGDEVSEKEERITLRTEGASGNQKGI